MIIPTRLQIAFLLSGAAGLIYQICWQRLLFSNFGMDIGSITIIVSSFMLGLGIGGWLGGRLADQFNHRSLRLFCFFEIFIGLYGIASPSILTRIGEEFYYLSGFSMGLFNFILVLPATILMGTTLPLLTTCMARSKENVGKAIGDLYTINTLGAMFGCLMTGFYIFNYTTLNNAIYIAASLNILVGTLVWSLKHE